MPNLDIDYTEDTPDPLKPDLVYKGDIAVPNKLPVFIVDTDTGQVRQIPGIHGDSFQVTEAVPPGDGTGGFITLSIAYGDAALFMPFSPDEMDTLADQLKKTAEDLRMGVDPTNLYDPQGEKKWKNR